MDPYTEILWRTDPNRPQLRPTIVVESSWNVMAQGDAREWKWRGNWRMEWVASTLHTASEHGASSITIADAHTSAASSRLNWRLRRHKWTRLFRRKKKTCLCACAITFQKQSTMNVPATKSSGRGRCVVGWVTAGVLKDPSAFTFRVKQVQGKCTLLLARLTLDIKAVFFFCGVGHHFPVDITYRLNQSKFEEHRWEEKSRTSFFCSADFNVSASDSPDIFTR